MDRLENTLMKTERMCMPVGFNQGLGLLFTSQPNNVYRAAANENSIYGIGGRPESISIQGILRHGARV
jgi:hypothetical protein